MPVCQNTHLRKDLSMVNELLRFQWFSPGQIQWSFPDVVVVIIIIIIICDALNNHLGIFLTLRIKESVVYWQKSQMLQHLLRSSFLYFYVNRYNIITFQYSKKKHLRNHVVPLSHIINDKMKARRQCSQKILLDGNIPLICLHCLPNLIFFL